MYKYFWNHLDLLLNKRVRKLTLTLFSSGCHWEEALWQVSDFGR